MHMSNDWGFETRQIHAGQQADPTTGSRAVPIYQTTAYEFRDSDHAKNLFALAEIGNIYTRIMNPTQAVVESRLASLEGGTETAVGIPGALALSSGQAAETLAILNLAESGDHIVSAAALYGGTYNLFHHTLPKMGITCTFIDDADDPDAWRGATQPNTKAYYCESIGNPMNNVVDIAKVAEIAHDNNVPLIVDGGSFDFGASGKHPMFTEPDPSYHGLAYWPALGAGSYIIKARVQLLRDIGAAIAPFNSFLLLQGLETLSLRMERHFSNSNAVVDYLASHDQVESVAYAGLPDSPWYDIANELGGGKGYGSVPAFVIKGGLARNSSRPLSCTATWPTSATRAAW